MKRQRIIAWAVIAVSAAFVSISPLGNFIALLAYLGFQSLFPSTISWDAKNAYLKCNGAIADPQLWPATPAAACRAMYLCANEAVLSDPQRRALYAQIRRTPGCQEP